MNSQSTGVRVEVEGEIRKEGPVSRDQVSSEGQGETWMEVLRRGGMERFRHSEEGEGIEEEREKVEVRRWSEATSFVYVYTQYWCSCVPGSTSQTSSPFSSVSQNVL